MLTNGTCAPMPSQNPKKTVRLRPELIEAIEVYKRLYGKDFNGVVSEALEAHLAPTLVAIRTAKLMKVDMDSLGKDPQNG